VSGKIRYGKITIEEGGELSGDVGTLQSSTVVSTPRSVRPEPPAPDIMAPYDPFGRGKATTVQASKA
jgi:hypothetical protein